MSALAPIPGADPATLGVSPSLLAHLEWRLRQSVTTMLTGDYRSVFRGRGMEFDQVVKYAWGDDHRDIDWNVTARLGEPYRKKFVEEREVSVLLVFEDDPSLQFGSAGRTRRDVLLELAALIMLIGSFNRDRIGLLYVSPTDFWLRRPVPGRDATLHTASMLLGQAPPPLDGPSVVNIPWRLLSRAASRHSVLAWLGPFAPGPEPEDWRAISRRYQTVGFRADDPWDLELPANERLSVFDPAAGAGGRPPGPAVPPATTAQPGGPTAAFFAAARGSAASRRRDHGCYAGATGPAAARGSSSGPGGGTLSIPVLVAGAAAPGVEREALHAGQPVDVRAGDHGAAGAHFSGHTADGR
jgi:hypothetical protein